MENMEKTKKKENEKVKRLYKGKDKMLGGVCSGLGEYFKLDPTIVRILWVFISLITGIFLGIFIYIILLIIIPERKINK
ncbi:MAG: PspC domain-containing protein [Candidatus Woesearchaeota archaeon]